MKKLLLSILTLATAAASAQNVNIPDANFKAYLVGNSSINTNSDTEIQVSEASAFTGTISCNNSSISDLTGIEAFVNLVALSCFGNSILSIDLSQNTALQVLHCQQNSLHSLDLSQNSALTNVYCSDNNLNILNLANGNNTAIVGSNFSAQNNSNLTCITVDDVTYSTDNWPYIDPTASFSTYCAPPCTVNIPDANFKSYLVANPAINTNGNSEIECTEAIAATFIFCPNRSISDLTGIEAFINITGLNCSENSLSTLDLSQNTSLSYFECNDNSLGSLNISQNTSITELYCSNNLLTSLDLSTHTNLTDLLCGNNSLTNLILPAGTNLVSVSCNDNSLNSLDISQCDDLTGLDCSTNDLTSIDLSATTTLNQLSCHNNSITSLDLSTLEDLYVLNCSDNLLTDLDISVNTSLTQLFCNGNSLTSIDISTISNLYYFECDNNALVTLNAANGNNANLISFSSINNPDLTCIQVDDVSYSTTNWTNIDPASSFSTNCLPPCVVHIPDANFKAYLVGNTAINTNGDTEIQCSEASAFTGEINVLSLAVADATGIEAFTEIESFVARYNLLTTLDLSQNTNLAVVFVGDNFLTQLTLSSAAPITGLDVSKNQLTSLDASGYPLIDYLLCNDNNLTTLNVANGNNINFDGTNFGWPSGFTAYDNPNLTCIQVDDATYSTTNWTNIDGTSSFSENCLTVGIEEEETLSFGLHPNPTNGVFTISSSESIELVEVFNHVGQKVADFGQVNTIDISNLPSGVYTIKATSNAKIGVARLIKQ